MALQLYSLGQAYVDGSLLAEEGQITIDVDSKAQEVNTVAKGFAGLSPGAAMINITIDNAVPAAGFEFNPGSTTLSLKVREYTFFFAGTSLTTKGFCTKYNLTHGVNQEAKLTMTIVAEPASFQ